MVSDEDLCCVLTLYTGQSVHVFCHWFNRFVHICQYSRTLCPIESSYVPKFQGLHSEAVDLSFAQISDLQYGYCQINLTTSPNSPLNSASLFRRTLQTAVRVFGGASHADGSILLRGFLGNLEELDPSGTSVKKINLRTVEAINLKHLILLGCKNLCANITATRKKKTCFGSAAHQHSTPSNMGHLASPTESSKEAGAASFHFNWCILVRDARLLRSLVPIKEYINSCSVHMEMDSPPASSTAVGGSEVAQGIGSLHQPDRYLYASCYGSHLQASAPTVGAVGWMWDCQTSPSPGDRDWYVHIQDADETKRGLLQEQGSSFEGTSTGAALPPSFICDRAWSLHVHDSSSLTCIPFPEGSTWYCLELCQVERCPKLGIVFATPQESGGENIFWCLTTFWASQLPVACYIWNWGAISQPAGQSFKDLVLLHFDYCPKPHTCATLV